MTKGSSEKVLIAAVAALIVATFMMHWIAAFSGIPILDGDALYFSPCIYNDAIGIGFTHPFWEVIPNNPGKLCIWHGWLYPHLAALLPWSKSYQTIGVSNLVLCVLSFLLSAVAVFLISKKNHVIAVLLCLPITLLVLHQVGRPELVVTGLIASAGIVLATSAKGITQRVALGALLGITAAASPSAGVCYALVTAELSVIRSRNFKDFLHDTLSQAMISVLMLLVATSLFAPVRLGAWLNGITSNATTHIILRESSTTLLKYYVFNPGFPLLAIYFIPVAVAIHLSVRKVMGWRKCLLLWLFVAQIAYVFYTAVRIPEANYNFMILIPAVLFADAHFVTTEPASKWLRYAIISVSGVAAIALMYTNLTVFSSLTGITQPEFALGMKVLSGQTGLVRTDMAFGVPLAEVIGYKHVSVAPDTRDASYIVVKQANSSALIPPQIPGYKIMINRFQQDSPRLFGIKIGNTRKDWSYAIFCRSDIC